MSSHHNDWYQFKSFTARGIIKRATLVSDILFAGIESKANCHFDTEKKLLILIDEVFMTSCPWSSLPSGCRTTLELDVTMPP